MGVLLCGAKYTVLERGFLQLVLSFLANTALKVWIHWHQQSGLPGVHASFVAVQPSAEKLWLGESQPDIFSLN